MKFVDDNISGFRQYYFSVPDLSGDENAITYHLVNYFNSLLDEKEDGFIPYKFVKNPPQPDSRKETDLGVVVSSKCTPSFPIIEFEAKRLSGSSNNSEYVYGERGGIERFKRNHHGARLSTCGMLGYVQSNQCSEWVTKINSWITAQAAKAPADLDWKNAKELLVHSDTFDTVEKWYSVNSRIKQSSLTIYHYLIDLVN